MSTPVTQMPKPDARQYEGNRKLFLVPVYLLGSDAPEEGQRLLEQYWSEVRGHVENLERSLGKVVRVYHEGVFAGGKQGMAMVEAMNPKGHSFVQAICQSGATLEATENGDLVHESSDWQRCISVGLMSQKVLTTAMEGFQEATRLRYERIGRGIDETLKGSESGILYIREDHRVQFRPTSRSSTWRRPPLTPSTVGGPTRGGPPPASTRRWPGRRAGRRTQKRRLPTSRKPRNNRLAYVRLWVCMSPVS